MIEMANTTPNNLTQEELNALVARKAARRALIAEHADRGFASARLAVNLPKDTYGEWVLDDPAEIGRFEMMGFRKATPAEFPNASAHGSGVDEIKVADVVLMVADAEVKELIDEHRSNVFKKRHGDPSRRIKGSLIEEQEFKTSAELPVIDESSTMSVGESEIRAATGITD